MNNVLQWILIAVLSSVIILILVYNVSPTLFKFDFLSFVSQTPANLGDIFQPKDLTEASQYEGYELSYDGMVLEKDAGYDNIDEVLKANVSIPDCSICPSSYCHSVNLGGINTYKCDECGICNGISQPNRFKNCLGCNITTETCILCADTDKEYALCNKIKETCILSQYRENNQNGCYIGEIPHNDGTSFNINTLLNVLSSCRSESIRINMGNNFMKELCYFNSSSISYYDFERLSDFYLSDEAYNENPGGTAIIACVDAGRRELKPFREENGELIENYRIYVAINTTRSEDYNIYVGNWGESSPGVCSSPPTILYKIGTIKTDSNGFGYAEFDNYGDADAGGGKTWRDIVKEDPTKNKMTGVEASHTWSGEFGKIWLAFYANNPESAGTWTNELRYSNCNFDTDIEPYLKDRPWWVSNPENLNSSWYIVSGNPNSSIKVFYDSSMPGGGNSLNRGNIKIQLGKLDVDFQRNCKFDIYVCSQDAFAEYEGENILNLNDFLKDFSPINVYKTYDYGNEEIILYNYFEFNLDKEYTVEEIKSVIKTGLRNWEQNLFPYLSSSTSFEWLKNNDGIYQGSWIGATRSLKYENDCWDNSLNIIMERLNGKLIIGNCQDNVCKEKIKIRIAFKYIKPNSTIPERDFLYPTVTFCDASNAPVTPPNPCSSYTSDSDCMFAGCRWCPSVTCNGGDGTCTGTSCTTKAECIGEDESPGESCPYRQKHLVPLWNCFLPFCSCPEVGFPPSSECVDWGACCQWWETCTIPASECY